MIFEPLGQCKRPRTKLQFTIAMITLRINNSDVALERQINRYYF